MVSVIKLAYFKMKMSSPMVGICIVFVSIVAATVSGSLTCLSCKDVPLPRDCQYTAKCGSHEVCYTNSYITTVGAVRHEMGCMDTKQCSGGIVGMVGRSTHNLLTCSECCNGTFCNSGLCGQTGIPPLSGGSRGPICYSCDQQLYPDSCHIIKECSRDQVCKLMRFESQVGHDILYKSECVQISECTGNSQQYENQVVSGNTFGKRNSRIHTRDNEKCVSKCCTSDLCNSDCSGANTTSFVSVPHTTPVPATTPVPTAVSPAQAADCRDTRTDCNYFYYTHCDTDWGHQNCPKTCGRCHAHPAQTTTTNCQDVHTDCYLYTNTQCNNTWGLQNCRKTCALCNVALNDPCIDHTVCNQHLNYCNQDWALQNCIRSCNRCKGSRST